MTVQYKMFQSKSLNTSAIVLLCVFIFYFSCVSIYAIVKIEKLESDLNASKKIVEILNDFISDMTDAREYEEDYDEDDVSTCAYSQFNSLCISTHFHNKQSLLRIKVLHCQNQILTYVS